MAVQNPMFFVVDVFANDVFAGSEKYSGNQVAVISYQGDYSDKNMLQIVKEIHFPESVFININKDANGGYGIRFFTSTEEIPYSGHACLGAAYVLLKTVEINSPGNIQLNLKKNSIQIDIKYRSSFDTALYNKDPIETLWIEHESPTFGDIYNIVLLSNILGLDMDDDFDDQSPIQEVFSGLPFIIVPLKNLRTLKGIEFNKERYYWLVKKTQAKAILVFCRQTENKANNLHVRVFADYYGIPEDAATGSGNGGLAAYLSKYTTLLSDNSELRIEQGYEIGRPSLVLITAPKQENLQIHVGGKVILVAKGEIL